MFIEKMYGLQSFDYSFAKLCLLSFKEYLFKISHWIFIYLTAKLHTRHIQSVTESSLSFFADVGYCLFSCDKVVLKWNRQFKQDNNSDVNCS